MSFERPPPHLPGFDSSFIEVEVESGGELRSVLALFDTGTNASVMRRRVVAARPRC